MIGGLQGPRQDLVQRGHVLAQGAHYVVGQLRKYEQRALLQAGVIALHALEYEGEQLRPPQVLICPARQLCNGVTHLYSILETPWHF